MHPYLPIKPDQIGISAVYPYLSLEWSIYLSICLINEWILGRRNRTLKMSASVLLHLLSITSSAGFFPSTVFILKFNSSPPPPKKKKWKRTMLNFRGCYTVKLPWAPPFIITMSPSTNNQAWQQTVKTLPRRAESEVENWGEVFEHVMVTG